MTTPHVPVLDLRPEIERNWDEYNAAIQKVLREGAFINGPDVLKFEEEIAAYTSAKHAIGMNSGTDALILGLKAIGIRPGDEVITTAFTFFATAEAISLVGAEPIFVDIRPDTYNLDTIEIEKKITRRTKAIIPVHLYGHGAAMDEVSQIAKKHGLLILEDVAQAFSGEFKGRKLGTIGDAGALSFFPSKNLGAFGDGGMLLTNNDEVAAKARMLRVHGARKKYHNEMLGYNSRLDTLQAAVLRVKLRNLDTASAGRALAATRYNKMLKEIPEIVTPVELPGFKHVYHQYTISVPRQIRNTVVSFLKTEGIETMVYYPVPLHKLPVYADKAQEASYPRSENAAESVLSLPIWPEITEETQRRVVEALTRSVKKAL